VARAFVETRAVRVTEAYRVRLASLAHEGQQDRLDHQVDRFRDLKAIGVLQVLVDHEGLLVHGDHEAHRANLVFQDQRAFQDRQGLTPAQDYRSAR
jgi:hypothetical protein